MSQVKNFKLKPENNYFELSKSRPSARQMLFNLLKAPFSIPFWTVSFLLARIVTILALDPSDVKRQRPVHLVVMSDKESEALLTSDNNNQDNFIADENDLVIVNLAKHESHKIFKDYLLKFNNAVMKLPFLNSIKRRTLRFDNPKHKAHIDSMLNEIDLLVQGKSTALKCKHRKFSWNQIHFKGRELLDAPLLEYFFNRLKEKYGTEALETKRTHNLQFFTLKTTDGAVLDSAEIIAAGEETKPMSQRTFVITCLPRERNFTHWIKDMNYSAQHIGCTMVSFNYRGVDYSKGMVWTHENMVNDVIAQVQRLIELGAKPENIGIEGLCLGGVTATIAAAKLHEDGYKVKLYNERSFRSMPRFLSGYILPHSDSSLKNPVTWLKYFVAGLMYVLLAPVLWLAGWRTDAASAWEKIPPEDKNYSVVRMSKDSRSFEETDGIIHDSWASMASKFDEDRNAVLTKEKLGKSLNPDESALLADNPEHHYFKPAPNSGDDHNEKAKQYGKVPHFLPRRKLVPLEENQSHPTTCHDHMAEFFKTKLGMSAAG
ncbi:alpha/beta hydrolase family protein [Legionella yabuuchiae]|uniref:alpha/beta hydrolase family protein n=1 Tax=Legionella yabuuchiae TaxID=376727 RepID=UPI001054916B|nr:alpha/beta hydrolase [Legionella yabuuchiae]